MVVLVFGILVLSIDSLILKLCGGWSQEIETRGKNPFLKNTSLGNKEDVLIELM